MPMPVSGGARFTKYSVKLDPATIASRITQVRELALRKAQDAQGVLATLELVVAPILDENGVVATERALYLGFAKKVWRAAQRHSGPALDKIVKGIKDYYVGLGANPVILASIAEAVVGTAGPETSGTTSG